LSRWSWAACPTETALPTFRPKRSTPKAPRAPFAPRVPSRLAAALVPVRWLDPFGARRSLFAPRAPLPFAVQSAIGSPPPRAFQGVSSRPSAASGGISPCVVRLSSRAEPRLARLWRGSRLESVCRSFCFLHSIFCVAPLVPHSALATPHCLFRRPPFEPAAGAAGNVPCRRNCYGVVRMY